MSTQHNTPSEPLVIYLLEHEWCELREAVAIATAHSPWFFLSWLSWEIGLSCDAGECGPANPIGTALASIAGAIDLSSSSSCPDRANCRNIRNV